MVLLGSLWQPVIPLPVTREARQLFEAVEDVPAGEAILIALDYGPASADELDAMSRALLHHAFLRDLKVLAVCFDQQGVARAGRIVREIAAGYGRQEGEDYLFLGFNSDMTAAIIQMGASIAGAFPTVQIGGEERPTESVPLIQRFRRLQEVALAVSMTGSKDYEKWIDYGNARFGLRYGVGATGAIATGLYPFLSSGQLVGLLRSSRGAADYERLVRDRYRVETLRPDASVKMSVQFLAHLLIVLLIVIANIGLWWQRRSLPTG